MAHAATNSINETTERTTGDRIERAAEKASDTAHAALRQGRELADQAQHVASDAVHGLEARIRRHPVQSALIAAGAGFLLALMARR